MVFGWVVHPASNPILVDISKTPWGYFFNLGANIHLNSRLNWGDSGLTVSSYNTFLAKTQGLIRWWWQNFTQIGQYDEVMAFYVQKVKCEPATFKNLFLHLCVLSESAVRAKQADECKGFVSLSELTQQSSLQSPLVLLLLSFRWLLLPHVIKLSVSPLYFSLQIVSACGPQHGCMHVPCKHEANWVVTNVSRLLNDVFFPFKRYHAKQF